MVSVKELCQMLQIGRNTAYKLIGTGEIRSINIGRQKRISKYDVIGFIEKNLRYNDKCKQA